MGKVSCLSSCLSLREELQRLAAIHEKPERAENYLMKNYREHDYFDSEAMEILVSYDASALLRLLRGTRPKGHTEMGR